jgi:TetR/AcrR family fatty acid metabolism transcriptional regulator
MARNNSKEVTRDRIINSAKKLFVEQGYQKTTIVDISRRAGFSEAALYEYFQGKEALLLMIPDLWVFELVRDLVEQLFGVKGAVNKLRKYLWWYMRRVEQSPRCAGYLRGDDGSHYQPLVVKGYVLFPF